MSQFFFGVILSVAIAWAGYKKHALSPSGSLGAVLVGTTIFVFGGWQWGVLLIAFFVTSSGLSFFKSVEKQTVAEKFEKGTQRDLWQTLANGGLAAVFAVLNGIHPSPIWAMAFAGTLATVTADTWATELGVLSQHMPRLITSGKKVAPGFSGGVTLFGTSSAFGGASIIGALAVALHIILAPTLPGIAWVSLSIGLAGLLGALADSVFGATVQTLYRCPACGSLTEQPQHHICNDTPTHYVRGLRWMNNDMVNFISSAIGAGLAAAFVHLLLP